jgi:hypothetical protein
MMISPEDHENAAMNELAHGGDMQAALIEAVLALASAVNRLAAAHDSLAETAVDFTPPRKG